MKNIKGCLTSNNQMWKTPFLIKYYMRHMFDPCPENPSFNGLEIEWQHDNFVNPPYIEVEKWVDKAIEELKKGKITIFLVPARTDTKWFKKLYDNNGIFIFIQGRLAFNDIKTRAPFPSMFVTLEPNCKEPKFNLRTRKELEEMMKDEYFQTKWEKCNYKL